MFRNTIVNFLGRYERFMDRVSLRLVQGKFPLGKRSALLLILFAILPVSLFLRTTTTGAAVQLSQYFSGGKGSSARTSSASRTDATSIAGLDLPEGFSLRGGELFYQCKKKESLDQLARKVYDSSSIFEPDHLRERLESENQGSIQDGHCSEGALVRVPDALQSPIRNSPMHWVKSDSVRAVYLRGENMIPSRLVPVINHLHESGANGVVFDVKDIIGVVNFKTNVDQVETLRSFPPPIRNLDKTIRYLHGKGIYVIARMALFQDQNLATKRPDLAIHNAGQPGQPGTVLLTKGHPLWVDPGIQEVRDYNLKIVSDLVKRGVDEIQFDYVRYPAEGDLSRAVYRGVRQTGDKTTHLAEFLSAAKSRVKGSGIRTSIDVFGVVAWGERVDISHTGQDLTVLSHYVDIISPMLYPSHFKYGFDGKNNPADQGYYFYSTGVRKVLEKSVPGIVVRPWVQAFRWRVSNYNEDYILQQIAGSKDAGGVGWMMWNAGNDYDLVYRALRKFAAFRESSSDSRLPL